MRNADIEQAIAALTPQQRAAWRKHWQAKRDEWVQQMAVILLAAITDADKRLQQHGY